MDWIKDVINLEILPETRIWVSIQHGRADYYKNHTAFAERDRVLVFPTTETAQYFIENWDREKMVDYKQGCLLGDYTFYVINKAPKGYWVDDIKMSNNYKPDPWLIKN